MQSIAEGIPGALAELLRGTPMSPGKTEFAWGVAVGPALKRVTAIQLEGDLLLVDAATPQWAGEISRSRDVILSRLQALLGPATVRRLSVRTNPSVKAQV
jgi:hypothetical protein